MKTKMFSAALLGLLFVSITVLFQNCGSFQSSAFELGAVDSSSSSTSTLTPNTDTTSSPSTVVQTPLPVRTMEDLKSMKSGFVYDLMNDIDLGKHFIQPIDGVVLYGHNHRIFNIAAAVGPDSEIPTHRGSLIRALSISGSQIKDIEFDFIGDLSNFPSDRNDLTQMNFVWLSSSSAKNLTVKAVLNGTHPNLTGNSGLITSMIFIAGNVVIEGAQLELKGDVKFLSKMRVSEIALSQVAHSTISDFELREFGQLPSVDAILFLVRV